MISKSTAEIMGRRTEEYRAQQAENRAAMPIVTAFVDSWRITFPNARVVYAEENGRTVGVRREWHEVSAADLPLKQLNTKAVKPPSKGLKQWNQHRTSSLGI